MFGRKKNQVRLELMEFVFLRDLADECRNVNGCFVLIKDGKEAEPIRGFSVNEQENRVILNDTGGSSDLLELTEEWIRSADEYRYWRSEVFDVVMEEGARYFAGEITAEKAAEYIQNRVSIYLAEQG